MNLKERIEQDLKKALLGGDKESSTTLRGLKSVILNAEIAAGKRDSGLEEPELMDLLAKEAKKRQESADLYKQANENERAAAELKEKTLIEGYLPEQLSEEKLRELIESIAKDQNLNDIKQLGQLIGAAKAKAGASADGAVIARIAREKLSS